MSNIDNFTIIKTNKENDSNAEIFVQTIKDCADITELNSSMLNTLIDKIVIHEVETVRKVEIFYKIVGVVDE